MSERGIWDLNAMHGYIVPYKIHLNYLTTLQLNCSRFQIKH